MDQGGFMKLSFGRDFTKEIKQVWRGHGFELEWVNFLLNVLTQEVILMDFFGSKEVNQMESALDVVGMLAIYEDCGISLT